MSPKRSVDTMIRFSLEPLNIDAGFVQWKAAMIMASRLPAGIPPQFRKQLWLSLADEYMESRHVDWENIKWTCLSERSNPDDDNLGAQIVKDLHRTGCSLFSGSQTEENQALLKMVLLAYARWNKQVGYCQGFNMLVAILLEVMEWQQEKALKVMIYLIEGVLPKRYFMQNMRDLSVDMAVFRDLVQEKLPLLAKHLNKLQAQAQDTVTGVSYEPPLLNVFTMQWFLTMFSTCLPKSSVLRVWDLVFLDGNQVLLQTALFIWTALERRVMTVRTADEFYSIMGALSREMLEFGIMEMDDLVQAICREDCLSASGLNNLRDKYAYNIRPLSGAVLSLVPSVKGSPSSRKSESKNMKLFFSDDEEDMDDFAMATWSCISTSQNIKKNQSTPGSSSPASSKNDGGSPVVARQTLEGERMCLDISSLKKQYDRIKERQKLAHIIMTGALSSRDTSRKPVQTAVSNLLVGKKPLIRRSRPGPSLQFDLKETKSKSGRVRRGRGKQESVGSEETRATPDVLCLRTGGNESCHQSKNVINEEPTEHSNETLSEIA